MKRITEVFKNGKLIATEVVEAPDPPTPREIVDREETGNAILRALIRREAKKEGKTVAQIKDEIAGEMTP